MMLLLSGYVLTNNILNKCHQDKFILNPPDLPEDSFEFKEEPIFILQR